MLFGMSVRLSVEDLEVVFQTPIRVWVKVRVRIRVSPRDVENLEVGFQNPVRIRVRFRVRVKYRVRVTARDVEELWRYSKPFALTLFNITYDC